MKLLRDTYFTNVYNLKGKHLNSFCETCVESVVRDRIVLGIRNPDIRQETFKKKRKLTLAECVDACRAMESATTHGSTLNSTTVNSIKRKHRKTIGNSKTSDCLFCGLEHPFANKSVQHMVKSVQSVV